MVDGTDRRVNSLVHQAVMSKHTTSVIVQNSADFVKVAAEKMTSTTVIQIDQSQIDAINATVNA